MSAPRVALGVAALLLFLAGVDVASRHLAENRIEARARAAMPEAASIEADLESFPFLPRLLAAGSAGDVGLRLTQVPAQSLQLTTVEAELRDVKLDRDALLSRQVSLRSIEGGTVSAELDAASLSRALGRQVTVGGGEVRSRVGPTNVSARPTVGNDGALVLRFGPLRLAVAVPRSKLLACSATRVAVVGDRVRLSCDIDDVPPALRRLGQGSLADFANSGAFPASKRYVLRVAKIAVSTEDLKGVGRGVERAAGDYRCDLGMELSDPPATAGALDSLKSEWQAGLQRLSDDVRSLGQLTLAVAHIYERSDEDKFAPVDP